LSVSLIEKPIWHAAGEPVRWNAICCGLMFIFLGSYLLRTRRKPHFEAIAVYLGWLLVLGAFVSGGTENGAKGILYILLLLSAGVWLAWQYFRKRRFILFSAGVLAAFIAWIEIVFKVRLDFMLKSLLVSVAAIGLVVLLWKTHRKMKESL